MHFSASARDLKDKIDVYRKIQESARLLGHAFHNDWVETAWLRETTRKAPWEDISEIVSNANTAISHADLIITEASGTSTFGAGYEVAHALQYGKPVLALVHESQSNLSYASGVKHDLLTVKEYNLDNLQQRIITFIKNNTITTKDLRFNFVIDRQLYSHLRSKSFQTGKTKAEIVRDLLLQDIKKP